MRGSERVFVGQNASWLDQNHRWILKFSLARFPERIWRLKIRQKRPNDTFPLRLKSSWRTFFRIIFRDLLDRFQRNGILETSKESEIRARKCI